MNSLTEKARKILGEDSDFIIIAKNDSTCGVASHGNTDAIAEAVFTCLHDSLKPNSRVLYRILKLNLLNILNNPSPFAADLAEAIVNAIPQDYE